MSDDPGARQGTYAPAHPVDVPATLGCLRRGGGDPTHRTDERGLWRTARTPDGPATMLITGGSMPGTGTRPVTATAWGPGGVWMLRQLPALLGAHDLLDGFRPAHPLLHEMHRRHPGLRVPRTGLVFEALVPAILEQKVTGIEARRAWRTLVLTYGDPAPGPAPGGMRVCPAPRVWARIPSWEWHRAGVDVKRSRTILAAAAVAAALERTTAEPDPARVQRALCTVPGIGIWTAAEVMQRAHGCADAVSVGDLHLPHTVGWALSGRRTDDAGMLALLEPYRPHRHRCVRLIELAMGAGKVRPPRFGPRYAPRDYRAI